MRTPGANKEGLVPGPRWWSSACPLLRPRVPSPPRPQAAPAQKDLREQKAFSKDSEHSGSRMGEQGQQTLPQSYGASGTALSKHPLYGGVS